MSDERDELVDLLHRNGYQSDSYTEAQADAVLAAGYRKPRVIAGAELDALPVGSIILDAKGYCWQTHKQLARMHHWFSATRNDGYYTSMNLVADDRTPATVLWEPQS